MADMSELRGAILNGDAAAAVIAAKAALDAGVEPIDLVTEGISPAMGEVGQLFEDGEYFVPELLVAARATKEVFAILRPLLVTSGAKPAGRVLAITLNANQAALAAKRPEGMWLSAMPYGIGVRRRPGRGR